MKYHEKNQRPLIFIFLARSSLNLFERQRIYVGPLPSLVRGSVSKSFDWGNLNCLIWSMILVKFTSCENPKLSTFKSLLNLGRATLPRWMHWLDECFKNVCQSSDSMVLSLRNIPLLNAPSSGECKMIRNIYLYAAPYVVIRGRGGERQFCLSKGKRRLIETGWLNI